MNKKKYYFLGVFLMMILLLSVVQSRGCELQGWKGNSRIHENKTIILTCPTCQFINISLINPNGEILISNDGMVKSGSSFSYLFNSTTLNTLGTYQIDGYSQLDEPLSLCFDVTINGKEKTVFPYFIILSLLIIFLIGLILLNKRYNNNTLDSFYKKMVVGYINLKKGNKLHFGEFITSLFIYGFFRSIIIIYYLIGAVFFTVLVEMIDSYSLSIYTLSLTLLNIYYYLSIFIGMYLFFLMMKIVKDVSEDAIKLMMGNYE